MNVPPPLQYFPVLTQARCIRAFQWGSFHAELLTDCRAAGAVQYAHVLFFYAGNETVPCLAVSSEVNVFRQGNDGSHYLCVFDQEGHHNHGSLDCWADLDAFTDRALEMAGERLALRESPVELPAGSAPARYFEEVSATLPVEEEVAGPAAGRVLPADRLHLSSRAGPKRAAPAGRYWLALLAVVGGLAVVLCGVFFLVLSQRTSNVWIDNGYPHAVTVEADGAQLAQVPARSQVKVKLKKGKHQLRTRGADGAVLSDYLADTEIGAKYIYNPGGMNWYQVETQEYSTMPALFASGKKTRDLGADEWLNVTAIDYIFEPMPTSIQMKSYGTESRTGIAGRPLEEKFPSLWVDNGYPYPVSIEMDGRKLAHVPADTQQKIKVRFGTHRFRAIDAGGSLVGDLERDVKPGGKYIFNPGRVNQYEVEKQVYTQYMFFGNRQANAKEDRGNEEWLDVADIHYIFEPLPATVQVESVTLPGSSVPIAGDTTRATIRRKPKNE